MRILDFFCTHCGNSENEVVVKRYDEIVTCKICNEPMQRKYSATTYNFRPSSGTTVPQHLLGGGNKAAFYPPD